MEVRRSGAWGTVCDGEWDRREAGVVCRSLGYAGAIAIGWADFGQGSGSIHQYNRCNGNEASIFDCSTHSYSCGHGSDAGVICRTQGLSLSHNISGNHPFICYFCP